jgi:hypothetical protein
VSVKDYRLPENRREYFDKLYGLNLTYGIMPGLVYLYMPELAQRTAGTMSRSSGLPF